MEWVNKWLIKCFSSSFCINGNYAISAIKLIQDINSANKFKIEIYDNNYSGETWYVDISKYNEYNYTFSYENNNNGTVEKTTVKVNITTIE